MELLARKIREDKGLVTEWLLIGYNVYVRKVKDGVLSWQFANCCNYECGLIVDDKRENRLEYVYQTIYGVKK